MALAALTLVAVVSRQILRLHARIAGTVIAKQTSAHFTESYSRGATTAAMQCAETQIEQTVGNGDLKMAARLIKVFVCDKDGKGLSGQKVNKYNGEKMSTDRNGFASFIHDGSKLTVFVNGTTVFDGFTHDCPGTIVYQKA